MYMYIIYEHLIYLSNICISDKGNEFVESERNVVNRTGAPLQKGNANKSMDKRWEHVHCFSALCFFFYP